MSKELIAKLKVTISEQKKRINDLKESLEYSSNANFELTVENRILGRLVKEKYYKIIFSGLSGLNGQGTMIKDQVGYIKGYSKMDAIQKHLNKYSPLQKVNVDEIKCISDD